VAAHDPRLAALAGLGAGTGLIEQTGAASFARRAIGADAAASVLTRDDGDARYQPLAADLGAIAALTTTAFGRGLLTVDDAAAGRGRLGLGTAAMQDVGSEGHVVPLLDGSNSWSGKQTCGAAIVFEVGANLHASGLNFYGAGANNYGIYQAAPGATGVGPGGDLTAPSGLSVVTVNALRFLSSNGPNRGFIWEVSSNGGTAPTCIAELDNNGVFRAAGGIEAGGIEVGYRDLPRVTGGLERGKCLAASGPVTIESGPAAGSCYRIYNDSGGTIALVQGSGLTLRLAGSATTGSRTLAQRGVAEIWFNTPSEAIVRGDVT
jgi:hypothetical protein